jgi:radical SAM protein with 4Fe4S-binding SPASM domain
MYINYRGEAVLCCNDWRFEVVLGDTAESSLLDIWTNDRYRAYREQLWRQNRHMPLCASCDYRGKPMPAA